jgi:hypothetical protein
MWNDEVSAWTIHSLTLGQMGFGVNTHLETLGGQCLGCFLDLLFSKKKSPDVKNMATPNNKRLIEYKMWKWK